MKYKEKVLIQTVICITVVSLLNGNGISSNERIAGFKDSIKSEINKRFTIDDFKSIGNEIIGIPETLNSVVMTANQLSDSSYPIDENSKDRIKNVRASSGGQVIFSGIDKELGITIKIKNANKIYTYGNLATINVITGDRVIKAETIGTYDSKSNKEFYYQLEDNMV